MDTSIPSGDDEPPPPLGISTAKILVGTVASILLAAAGMAVRTRTRGARTIRRPAEYELDAITDPIARILSRHIPAGIIPMDVADVLDAATATLDYAAGGLTLSREDEQGE